MNVVSVLLYLAMGIVVVALVTGAVVDHRIKVHEREHHK